MSPLAPPEVSFAVKVRDVAERTVVTYLFALVGLLLASGAFDASGTVHVDLIDKALWAAVPAALAVIVNTIRVWLVAPPKTFMGDLLLRVVLTYLETFVGLLAASEMFTSGAHRSLSTVVSLGVASIPSALSLVKGLLAKNVAPENDSASLDPNVFTLAA